MSKADIIRSFSGAGQQQLQKDYAASGFPGSFEDFVTQQADYYGHLQEGDPRLKTFFYGDDLQKYEDATRKTTKPVRLAMALKGLKR